MGNPAVTTLSIQREHRPSFIQLLTFDVGGRRLALPATAVGEVTWAVAVTPLSKAPPIVEGVINVRGTVVPVLDIRHRLTLPAQPVALHQHFIVAHAGHRLVALRVDRALDLVSVPEEAIETAARAGSRSVPTPTSASRASTSGICSTPSASCWDRESQ